MTALQNENPTVYEEIESGGPYDQEYDDNEDALDPLTAREIFNLIRNINDPEHPLTLQQVLSVSHG